MGADAASIYREEEHESTPPAGEEVHMPASSLIPLINAFGLALLIVSLTLAWYLVVIGGAIFLVSTIVWIRDVRTEVAALPADHGHH